MILIKWVVGQVMNTNYEYSPTPDGQISGYMFIVLSHDPIFENYKSDEN